MRKIEVDELLYGDVERLIRERRELGYLDVEEFVREAVRMAFKELGVNPGFSGPRR